MKDSIESLPVAKDAVTGCWLWQRRKTPQGYGILARNGVRIGAHKFAYQLANGLVPAGLIVRHKCDVPACVNPDHLCVGTQADNVADKVSRGRQAKGRKVPTNRLSEDQVRQIRSTYVRGKTTLKQVAEDFDMSLYGVWAIVTRKNWGWLQ